MKILLIVGSADSIFIHDMVKWLKKSMDISIDIYELERIKKRVYVDEYYNARYYPTEPSWMKYLPSKLSNQLVPIWKSHQLRVHLKSHHYDIIQCHWIVPSLVLIYDLKDYCSNICATFWGGELTHLKLFKSKSLYRLMLKKFLKNVDYIVNSKTGMATVQKLFLSFKGNMWEANLGSASIQHISEMLRGQMSKSAAKLKLHMPLDKCVVLIGYSGKSLHQHLPIIQELKKLPALKEKIHIFAPMTRDTCDKYIVDVENALIDSKFSYTLMKGQYLSDEDVAVCRMATDIVFQFSTFDGLSRSILECISAKSLLLYADWLNYDEKLKEYQIKAFSASSISEGVLKLNRIVDSFEDYSFLLEENSDRIINQLSWNECILDWINLYKSIVK